MFKHACVIGVFLASVGSLALSQEGPAPRVERVADVPLSPENDAESVPALGLSVEPVSAALAAHLGIEVNTGLLVTAVQADSRAAAAGLLPFDVIVEVDSEPARLSALDTAQDGDKGLALDVIRSGVEARIAVPAANAPDGFLSTAHLGPDHPFRRLEELDELKASYAEKAENYSQRMRELDQSSREAREEAKRQVAALQEACDEQVAEYLAARQRELLELLETRIDDGTVTPLRELAIELEALVPGERIEAVDQRLQDLNELLRNGLTKRLEIDNTGSDDQANRARNRFEHLQNELGSLLAERVGRPWSQDLKQVDQQRQRLGKQYTERMQWTAKTIAAIRVNVHDRITCAIERTQEEFSKRLRRRLNEMEVPQPGEVEAVLEDMHAQIRTMTERFIRRTEFALDQFVAQMEEGNDELVAGLQGHFPECEEAATMLDETIRELVARNLESRPLVVDATWHTRTRIDDRHDTLREAVRLALNDGRNAMRSGSVGLAQDLKEHKVVSEDSWRDLQQLLGEILGAAKSDCWKLDGPHLDGRFPQPRIDPGVKGEVALR